jgi:hypothetical protein
VGDSVRVDALGGIRRGCEYRCEYLFFHLPGNARFMGILIAVRFRPGRFTLLKIQENLCRRSRLIASESNPQATGIEVPIGYRMHTEVARKFGNTL